MIVSFSWRLKLAACGLQLEAYSRWPWPMHHAAYEQAYDLQVAQAFVFFLPGLALQQAQYSR